MCSSSPNFMGLQFKNGHRICISTHWVHFSFLSLFSWFSLFYLSPWSQIILVLKCYLPINLKFRYQRIPISKALLHHQRHFYVTHEFFFGHTRKYARVAYCLRWVKMSKMSHFDAIQWKRRKFKDWKAIKIACLSSRPRQLLWFSPTVWKVRFSSKCPILGKSMSKALG